MDFDFLTGDLFGFFFKAFLVVLSAIYLIYTIVLFRQAQVMTRTVTVEQSPFIIIVSFLHILAAVGLLLFALAIL